LIKPSVAQSQSAVGRDSVVASLRVSHSEQVSAASRLLVLRSGAACRGALVRRFSLRGERQASVSLAAGSVACCARFFLAVCSCGFACPCVGTHGTDWFGLWFCTFPLLWHCTTVCTRNSYSISQPLSSTIPVFHPPRRTRPLRVACLLFFAFATATHARCVRVRACLSS
jgi:hypothetical protein